MKLKKIFKDIAYLSYDDLDNLEIHSIEFNSAKCVPNTLFFALAGTHEKVVEDVRSALKNGATAIVCDHWVQTRAPQILVPDLREVMAKACSNFFDNPADKLKTIGITGTNGKTTSTYLLKNMLESAGHKVGLIGTNCHLINKTKLPASLTTPDPFELYYLLDLMVKNGCEYAVMEVSAHALYFKKVAGINFDCAIFSNLTQDHLDFFKTLDTYFYYKSQLFLPTQSKLAVINTDDEYAVKLAQNLKKDKLKTYGMSNAVDLSPNNIKPHNQSDTVDVSKNIKKQDPSDAVDATARNIKMGIDGSTFTLNLNGNELPVLFKMAGKFNIYNVLATATCASALGIPPKAIVQGIENTTSVDGRYNVIKSDNEFYVVIDYAHSPDGLENILKSVNELNKGRTIVVFGCGGNRDKTKRAIMGNIAGELADYTILTSDNPRYEEPSKIIEDIESGIKPTTNKYISIVNRKHAIEYALQIAKPNDIIIIAGKGAETYQEINGEKHHFCDAEIVTNKLNQMQEKLTTQKQQEAPNQTQQQVSNQTTQTMPTQVQQQVSNQVQQELTTQTQKQTTTLMQEISNTQIQQTMPTQVQQQSSTQLQQHSSTQKQQEANQNDALTTPATEAHPPKPHPREKDLEK